MGTSFTTEPSNTRNLDKIYEIMVLTLDNRWRRTVIPERGETNKVVLPWPQVTAWRVSKPQRREGGT